LYIIEETFADVPLTKQFMTYDSKLKVITCEVLMQNFCEV